MAFPPQSKRRLHLILITTLGALVGVALWLAGEAEAAPLRLAVGVGVALLLYLIVNLGHAVAQRADFALHLPPWGWTFIALAVGVGILAFTSGNNLLYLLLSILLATLFVSLLAARLSLSRLQVNLTFPDHLFVAEPAPLTIELVNGKRLLPAFSLTVWSGETTEEPVQAPLAYFPIIPARTMARARIERRYDRRGIYRVGGLTLVTRFPFGLIEQRRFLPVAGELAVYPQPLAVEELERLLPVAQGRVQSRTKGAGGDLYALRGYVPSDHRRLIDWKATARTAQLMVREFHHDDEWQVTIAFDNRVAAEQLADEALLTQFERAVRAAAGLTEQFLAAGAEVRMLACKKSSGFGRDQQHYYAMLRLLARLRPQAVDEATSSNQPAMAETADGDATPGISDNDDRCQSLRDEHAADEGLYILLTSRPTAATAAAHVIRFDEV